MTGTTAKHPNVEVWEKVYDTFTTGDMDRLAQLISPDVVRHVSGDNLISGTYTTREAIFGCFNEDPRWADRRAREAWTEAPAWNEFWS